MHDEMHKTLLNMLARELWPRTLDDLGVSSTTSYAQLVEIANRELPPTLETPNLRIYIDLLHAAKQVCATNTFDSVESMKELARVVSEAKAFHEWREQLDNVTSLNTAPKEDPLDTKFTMRGVKGNVELNLGKAPTAEQMIEATISATESTSGQPADLAALLNYFKKAVDYLEKRIAEGATRRLRLVREDPSS
jgi:hypothetical protein